MEMWDVYDVHRNKIKNKIISKGSNNLRNGEYHLVVTAWILQSNDTFLMQKRAFKEKYPNVYANHGGCVISNENSKEAMIRELQEEIGLHITSNDLIFLRTFHDHESIFDEYIIEKDIDINSLVLDQREVDSCVYLSISDIEKLIPLKKCFDYQSNNPNGESTLDILKEYIHQRKRKNND